MKNLLLALTLILPLSANAVEMWEGETAEITCNGPTTYADGVPIHDYDTIKYNLYVEGESIPVEADQPACSFTVSPPVGEYIYRTSARSTYFGTESVLSEDNAEVVVNVKKRPNMTTGTTARVLPQ